MTLRGLASAQVELVAYLESSAQATCVQSAGSSSQSNAYKDLASVL